MKLKVSNTAGLPPGTLTYVGNDRDHEIKITVIDYDQDNYHIQTAQQTDELISYRDRPSITWINVDGVHDLDLIRKLGDIFDIHPLLLEDIVNTSHRPKLEEHDEQIYFTMKMLFDDPDASGLRSEQVSIIIGRNYVLSFQETSQDIFDQVRQRIETAKGRIRSRGSDYLVYTLVDAVVDSYFSFIEQVDNQLEELEDKVLAGPEQTDFQLILNLKKELEALRRFITPLREALGFMEKSESVLIDAGTRYFFRDVYDHILLVTDSIDSSRNSLNNIMDTFNSTISNHMNQVMKTLTIVGSIFIPLTFIAGIYGMNFAYMPELQWKWGYFGALGLMSAVVLGMIIYLKKNKWI